ncbi:D-aminoacyl-tRNA deacylase [Candidatus Entotheonellaceae bacterium PAL068K]
MSIIPQYPLPLFDAHAHMYAEVFASDLEDVLSRAKARGVQAVLTVSETQTEAQHILRLAQQYPIVKPGAGLYPTILDREAAAEMLAFIRRHHEQLVAIGEVGLDYWKVQDAADREVQREILAQHIELARDLDLPLNVHSRSAGRHAIAWLRDHGAERVLMHAFDGKASAARAGIEAGYYFSIPPSIVRSPQKQKLVRHLPIEHLLLESDAPVLGPDRDQRNEPCNVWLSCEQIAALKGLPVEEVAHTTTANAQRLFPRAFA